MKKGQGKPIIRPSKAGSKMHLFVHRCPPEFFSWHKKHVFFPAAHPAPKTARPETYSLLRPRIECLVTTRYRRMSMQQEKPRKIPKKQRSLIVHWSSTSTSGQFLLFGSVSSVDLWLRFTSSGGSMSPSPCSIFATSLACQAEMRY